MLRAQQLMGANALSTPAIYAKPEQPLPPQTFSLQLQTAGNQAVQVSEHAMQQAQQQLMTSAPSAQQARTGVCPNED